MARGSFPGMPMGGGGKNNMMKQLQKMQKEMEEAQQQLEITSYEASAGGGAVKAVVSGDKRLTEIQISPDAVDPDDLEMLNDLIVAAVNEALSKADADAASKMSRFTSGLDLKGLF